jgi:hypothetical protein
MIVATCGVMSAQAPPCTIRETISRVPLGATPQASEATVKPTRPIRKSRRWP